MTWVTLKGEGGHICDLPWSVSITGPGATNLQKRHAGSVWKCSCDKNYEWSGKKWKELK